MKQDDITDYSGRIVSVCSEGNVVQVRLLLEHSNGNTWHDFSPDKYPELKDCYAKALEFAGSFGIQSLDVDFVQLTESSIYPDDFV